jgi:hypothetical protein
MRLYNVLTPAMALAASLLLAGCQDSMTEVSGTVLADGQPLEEGEIIFEEADQSKGPAAAKVTAGKYALRMTPGSKKVRITASRPAAKPDPVMGTAAREMMIPAEFNESSRLTVEIRSGRQTGVDFQVTTIPPAPGPK